MTTLNEEIREYVAQLGNGKIQKAYKGIMTLMSELRADLECRHPDYSTSALYLGTMDMTYFAFTPLQLKRKKLKIAIVFLHETCKFEVWLAGQNRQIQAEVIQRLSQRDLGNYKLSRIQPGVDAIIASVLVENPDFNHLEELKAQLELKTLKFTEDMISILG
jgi:hypothetical protein